jgi:putative ABC transport system permease protein
MPTDSGTGPVLCAVIDVQDLDGVRFYDTPGAPVALVLSHSVWIQRFGGDPTIAGRTVRVGSDRGPRTGTIVGVMPREFDFPRGAQVWMALAPYAMGLKKDETSLVIENRGFGVLYALGRLRSGMTVEDGRRELAALIPQIHPNELGHRTAVVTPLVHHLLGPSHAARWSIFALALLVWLLASANVAACSSCSLVRTEARDRSPAHAGSARGASPRPGCCKPAR